MLTLWMTTLAFGSATYPGELQTLTDAICAPSCTACHDSEVGGSGTVVQPFGTAMVDRGLTGGSDLTALGDALLQLETDAVDSDGDGTLDVDELASGDNPNNEAEFCDQLSPTYGCLSHAGSVAPGSVGGMAALLGLGLVFSRRRRTSPGS